MHDWRSCTRSCTIGVHLASWDAPDEAWARPMLHHADVWRYEVGGLVVR